VVASAGGQPSQIEPNFKSARSPIWCSDGKHLIFLGEFRDESDWWVAPLDEGAVVRVGISDIFRQHGLHGLNIDVLGGTSSPELWLPGTDSVVFPAISGDSLNLWQIAISPKTWQIVGGPRRLMSGAGMEGRPSVAGGRLVFTALSQNTNVWGLPIDANSGKVLGDIGRLTEGAARDIEPSISIDGRKLAFSRVSAGTFDIWLKDLESGQERRLASRRSPGTGLSIAGDGSKVIYTDHENEKFVLYSVSTNGGEPEKVYSTDYGFVLDGVSRDGGKILAESSRGITLVDTAAGQNTVILKHPQNASIGRFSPDDRWIALHTITSPATRRIFIAPFRGAVAVPESEWISITDGQAMDRYAWWSPDGNLLYFVSERDGFVCFWAQRLDARKQPQGAAFPVRHFHTARRALGDPESMGMSVGTGRLVFSMTEQTGNIWMTTLDKR